VQWGHVNVNDLPTMDFRPEDETRFRLASGDVLVCEGGEVGRAAIWTEQLAECYYQKALHRVRTSEALSPRYLRYLLEYYARTRAFAQLTSGSTIAHLPQEDLRNLPVDLPPPGEQERIVTAIEEQFSRLDAGVEALKSALLRIETLAKAVLVAAVPEVPPATWAMSTIGQAGEVRLGRQRSPKFHAGPNMRPYLRVANVFEDRIDAADIMTMQFSEAEFARYQLRAGDVLLNEGQSPHLLGRAAMYRGDPPDVAYTNSLLRFRANPGVLPSWALLVFRRHLHARRFMAESQITTNIAHLSAGRFKSIEFPVPPMAEQKLIVDAVHEQLSVMELHRSAVQRSLIQARHLGSAVLAAAFSGKLVHQDPTDEPAPILLGRIATDEPHQTVTSQLVAVCHGRRSRHER